LSSEMSIALAPYHAYVSMSKVSLENEIS